MSVGFRKSLFGYNQDDVIDYIKKLHASFADKEAKFESQISELEENINSLCLKLEASENEKSGLQSKVDEYNSKRAEMERLSENIGKLYLVAQTGAKTVMTNAEEDWEASYAQIERNVSAIEETHSALDELRKNIRETADSFNNELTSLMASLEETKEKLSKDREENGKVSEEFSSLMEAVSK